MKILLTGFDPFGGESINPSWEVVRRIPKKIKDVEIKGIQIPTVFQKSFEVLKKEIESFNPDVVICVGQAGGRQGITPERIAINIDDARIADNEENQPIDFPIQKDGESAYFSTLPIKAMVDKMIAAGFSASVSNTAGTFVCNHIMYQVLYYASKNYPTLKAGFIHVPFLPEQVKDKNQFPSMELEEMVHALTLCVETVIEYQDKEDLKAIGGAIH